MKVNIFYILLFALAGCSRGKDKSQSDKDITKVKLLELDNQPIDFEKYKGKAVFINFWATWCKPCIQEMPTIENAQKILTDKDVIFLLASDEEQERIDKFTKKHSYNFHYVHLENLAELKIQALPATFIFNTDGKLKFSESGYRNWADTANIELITKIINDYEK